MKSIQEHHYDSHVGTSYSSTRSTGFVIILIISKAFLGLSYFIIYDLLKIIHVVHFLFLGRIFASAALIAIQKPFSSGRRISKQQWIRIIRHGTINSMLLLLWLFGLTQCGPLRTILLVEHKDFIIISGISALFTGAGGHSKFRGAVCFLIGILALLFLDHDDNNIIPTEHPEGHQHHGFSHVFFYVISWLGLADHKGGVLLLVLVVCLQTGFNSAARRLSVDIGGAKRLNALSSLVSSILLIPWAITLCFTSQLQSISIIQIILPTLVSSILLLVIDYYVESMCTIRLEALQCARYGSIAVFLAALLFTSISGNGIITYNWSAQNIINIETEHALSGGVIFSWIMFMLAILILTSPAAVGSKGTFVGYSSAGLPLYTFTGDTLHHNSQSFLLIIKNSLVQILEESDSRKIFYFLCLNLAFTFVEMIYGIWTNSLGLISDGFHMLFDCSALVMGLCASILARKKATKTYPYGFGRVEVLSGFINGLFLVVVAFMVFTEALSRIFDPPKILTERLLTVSVAGLCVNLVGIFAFRHAHTHSHSPSSSHGHGHSHSHSHHHHHADNTNIQGVFLHILADTLGSIGVISSSLLIEHFDYYIADPICSLFISVLIFLSVLPLLKHSSLVLLLRVPRKIEKEIFTALNKVMSIDGVLSYSDQHFWQHSAVIKAGTIHVQVRPDASEQKIINQIQTIFKDIGFVNFTVQVEKEEYFHHMSGLSSNYQNMLSSITTKATRDMATTVIKAI